MYSPQDETYWMSRPLDDKEHDWKDAAPTWLQGYKESLKHPHRELMLEIVGEMQPAQSLVEIGCNCGPNLERIKEAYPSMDLYGIDANPDAVKMAEKNFSVVCGNMLTLPWDRKFDILLSDAALMYVKPEYIFQMMEEISRVTDKVIFFERDAANERGAVKGHVWGRNYKKLLEKMGYKVFTQPITKHLWPTSKSWQKYGRVYVGVR